MEVLCHMPLSVVVSASSSIAGRKRVEPSDLADMQLIVTPRVWNARQAIEQAFREDGVVPYSVAQCGNMEIVKSCVLDGQGASVLPDFTVAEEVRRGRLVRLSVPLLLAHALERGIPVVGEAFIRIARELFREPGA